MPTDIEMLELRLAVEPVRAAIPVDKTLTECLQFAMRYVRDNANDLFWMSARTTDDVMFRTALAAVMLAGSEDDKDVIERSMKPLRALTALLSGVPIDMAAIPTDKDLLPLMKLWHESEPGAGGKKESHRGS